MSIDVGIYATFSYDAYNPYLSNKVPNPSDWVRVPSLSSGRRDGSLQIAEGNNPENSLFGFGAAVYRNTATGDVVISFRGTEPWSQGWFPVSGGITDLQAGLLGLGTPQLMEAVDLYIEVRKAFPNTPLNQITFTEHSLGGGLAPLMAIMFDHDATTFAQAPFESALLNPLVHALVQERVTLAA